MAFLDYGELQSPDLAQFQIKQQPAFRPMTDMEPPPAYTPMQEAPDLEPSWFQKFTSWASPGVQKYYEQQGKLEDRAKMQRILQGEAEFDPAMFRNPGEVLTELERLQQGKELEQKRTGIKTLADFERDMSYAPADANVPSAIKFFQQESAAMDNPVVAAGIDQFAKKNKIESLMAKVANNTASPQDIASIAAEVGGQHSSALLNTLGSLHKKQDKTPEESQMQQDAMFVAERAPSLQEFQSGMQAVREAHPNVDTKVFSDFAKDLFTQKKEMLTPVVQKAVPKEAMYELAMFGTPEQQTKYKAIIKKMQADEVEQKKAGRNVTGLPVTGGTGELDSQGLNPKALEGLDAGRAAMIKKMANYEMPIPNPRSKEGIALASILSSYDPSYDAQLYPIRQAVRKSFTSGPDAKNKTSLNTAIHHLEELDKAIDEMGNTRLPAWNYLKNKYKKATGNPSVDKVINTLNAVVGETATVFKGTGATDQEIKHIQEGLSISGSPQQLKDAGVKQITKLLQGRLDALIDKYQTGMGTTKGLQILDDKSLKTLQKFGIDVDRYKAFVKGRTGDAGGQIGTDYQSAAQAELARRKGGK